MLKIRRLGVHGFRGILRETELDLTKRNRSLVLIGDNGTGKSSFVDAVEWLLTGRIEHLASEGCGVLAYRHRLLKDDEDARVELVTSDQTISGNRTLDGKRRSKFDVEDGPLANFADQARGDTVILRYSQMRDFVDKTKTEKLKYLAEILGMGALSQLRDELLKTHNSLRRDQGYKYLISQIKDYERRLSKAVKPSVFTKENTLELAEKLRQTLGGRVEITDLASLQRSTDELLARSQRDARTRQIMALRQNLDDLKPLVDSDAFIRGIKKLSQDVSALCADKEAVDQVVLAELYESGQKAIERKAGDSRLCPLCGQKVDRRELLDHLCINLKAIEQIRTRLDALGSARNDVVGMVRKWQSWLNTVRVVTAKVALPEGDNLSQATDKLVETIENWEKELRSPDPLQPVPLPTDEELGVIVAWTSAQESVITAIHGQLRKLEGTTEQQAYYDTLERLDRLTSDFLAWLRAREQKKIFDQQIETIGTIHALCEQTEREVLEEVLDAVSADVNKYYLKLHPGEGFDQIRLWPTRARGVEFEFTFHGEKISPPGQLMSESHLNTLGICLFLSSARHFNRYTRFLVLDDIINSVDAAHRTPLARLLRDEFSDFQLVLLTHDRMWFDILRRTAPRWMTREIGGWSYEDGLWFRDRPGDLEDEARQYLDQGDIPAAGNKARRWLERVLKERCYDLEVTVPFRHNDRNEERMPGELLPAMRKTIEKTQIYSANSTLFQDLEASTFIGSRLSHDNVYQSAPPQVTDVDLFLQDVRRLDDLFLCPDCSSYIAFKHTPDSARRKRCKCGKLELR